MLKYWGFIIRPRDKRDHCCEIMVEKGVHSIIDYIHAAHEIKAEHGRGLRICQKRLWRNKAALMNRKGKLDCSLACCILFIEQLQVWGTDA
ncbi:hypothetical protein KAS45_07235 [candidate division WOR-3 bacterium]|nr:hypothetical protein [candidate division WOR-3 bacterium]